MSMPIPKLPIWMDADRATALRNVAVRWWDECLGWLSSPLELGDALTAPLAVVDLYAYQRGIKRSAIDTDRRYRLKVHHAMRNAIDAGTRVGMRRIFERLELPVSDFAERMPGYDWDVIGVDIDARDIDTQRPYLLDVWGLYRRTCRRMAIRGHIDTASRLQVAAVGAAVQVLHTSGAALPVQILSESRGNIAAVGGGITILTTAGGIA